MVVQHLAVWDFAVDEGQWQSGGVARPVFLRAGIQGLRVDSGQRQFGAVDAHEPALQWKRENQSSQWRHIAKHMPHVCEPQLATMLACRVVSEWRVRE